MNEDLGVVSLLLFFLSVCCICSYGLGRRLERKTWEKALPQEMMKLCLQCRDVGN